MSDTERQQDPTAAPDGYNAGYAEELAESSLRRRGLVPPPLVEWMADGGPAAARAAAGAARAAGRAAAAPEVPDDRLRAAAIAGALVEAYRDQGHLAVRLDPLGSEPPSHPSLRPRFYEIDGDELASLPAAPLGLERLGDTVGQVLDRLQEVYCGTVGYELDHVENPAERDWLIEYIESGRHRTPLTDDEKRRLLERLTQVEGLESFLHRSYLGKKRFSAEGLDMMIPMLDELLERSAGDGVREVLIGMAHRGRLNVLAHIVGRDYRPIVAEFEGAEDRGLQSTVADVGAGDVKYHVGARGRVETAAGPLAVSMAPNPSHLEHVNPVVEGMARAAREQWLEGDRARELGFEEVALPEGGDSDLPVDGPRRRGAARRHLRTAGARDGERTVLPILIHGDAAFMGQGVAAETLNLSRLRGYETGGTVHLIANNQLGFTTRPEDGRSTRYASDLALGFRLPVVHVNADDPEACLAAIRLAADYRGEFAQDIVVDLVGYRRYGHNEGDEPGYTQPSLYRRIDEHPTVRTRFARRLAEEGLVSEEKAAEMADRLADELREVQDEVRSAAEEEAEAGNDGPATPTELARRGQVADRGRRAAAEDDVEPFETPQGRGLTAPVEPAEITTTVDRERLLELNDGLHTWPEDFELYRKLGRQLEGRHAAVEEGEPLDWAHAEALAFASLVTEGVAVRLSGEDTERGTFSQRHLVLHDVDDARTYTPLAHLEPGQARFQIWNSPLSEVAALGFEYGYSTIATDSLVLWEAQFGDFVNVGQAMVDQFIASGRTKWGQESRLTLLLPHGYEGQGPEHSSGRPERFLQLAAEGNIRVANCTTPAQYFHLLRLQARRPDRRPLVVLTPKSLLRHPRAKSPLAELADGSFRSVLPDPGPEGAGGDRAAADGEEAGEARGKGPCRAILCSGKIFYDLVGSDARDEHPRVTVLRVERLYPFPEAELRRELTALPGLEAVTWAQEEPENMGAWRFVRPRLQALLEEGTPLRYAGRPPMASPAEGFASAHEREQARIVGEAFAGPEA